MSGGVRIPPGLNDEDPLLMIGGVIRASMRQLITLAAAIGIWIFLASGLEYIIPWGILAYVLASPILLIGLLFAFKRMDGQTMEAWLADRLLFMIESRRYTLVNTEAPDPADLARDWSRADEW